MVLRARLTLALVVVACAAGGFAIGGILGAVIGGVLGLPLYVVGASLLPDGRSRPAPTAPEESTVRVVPRPRPPEPR